MNPHRRPPEPCYALHLHLEPAISASSWPFACTFRSGARSSRLAVLASRCPPTCSSACQDASRSVATWPHSTTTPPLVSASGGCRVPCPLPCRRDNLRGRRSRGASRAANRTSSSSAQDASLPAPGNETWGLGPCQGRLSGQGCKLTIQATARVGCRLGAPAAQCSPPANGAA